MYEVENAGGGGGEGEGEDENGEEEEKRGLGDAADESAAAAPAPAPADAPPPPPTPPSLAAFSRIVVSAEGATGSAVDLGVYTRNRAWRMSLSSKADAPARVLRPLSRRYGGVDPDENATISDRAAFFCGLAGDVPLGFKLLSVEGAVYGGGGGPPGRRSSFAAGAGGAFSSSSSSSSSSFSASSSSSLRARPGPSPFPAVDAFIEGVATSLTGDGRQATVRSWAVAEGEGENGGQQPSSNQNPPPTTTTLVLSLRDGRFCGGVGRPHRSNGVYYVVDLRSGTFRQRCHDPECRGYRSPAAPLPADVARAAAPFAAALSLGASHSSFPSFQGIDGDEAATRRFLAAIDAAEAVALEERDRGEMMAATATRKRMDSGLFEEDGGDGGDEDQALLFAAVDAAVAEAAAKRERDDKTME